MEESVAVWEVVFGRQNAVEGVVTICTIGISRSAEICWACLKTGCSLRIFPVRNYFLTCANIGLRGRDLLLIADQKTYQKVQPD
jgi:hypothetical protein